METLGQCQISSGLNSLQDGTGTTGLNYIWPGTAGVNLGCDAMWWHRTGSTLAQAMACCLMAPSHWLNRCWFFVSEVQWHSPESNFTSQWVTKLIFCIMTLKVTLLKLHPQSLVVNELIFPWGTFIFPQNYLPPWMTISSSNYESFEIHWVRLHLVNFTGLAGIVNTTVHKFYNSDI